MDITLYHGTNKDITDGLASGTYFSNDINVAKKYGNTIYTFTGDVRHFYKDIFNEHYIASHFIPLKYLGLEVL